MPAAAAAPAPPTEKPAQVPTDQVRVVIVLALLLATGLRVLLAVRSGLWRDEALFLFVTRLPTTTDMLDFLRWNESHPPLFYLLMRALFAVFGPSANVALGVSVVLGIATVAAVYGVGVQMLGRRAALIAAALAAASPTLSLHSALARPYSLLPLLCLLSTFFLWRGLRGGRMRDWAGFGLTTLCLLLTHNWGWVVYVALGLTAVAAFVFVPPRPRRVLARDWLLTQAAVLAVYAPWFPALLYQSRHAGHGGGFLPPFGEELLKFARTSLFFPGSVAKIGGENDEIAPGVIAAALLTGLTAYAIRKAWRRTDGGAGAVRDDVRLAVLLTAGIPLLAFVVALTLSTRSYLLLVRCLATVVPCLLLAMSYGVASLSRPGQRLPPMIATAVLMAVSLATSLAQVNEIKSNAQDVAAAVAARARPTDLVVVTPVWMAPSFNYYFSPGNPQINYPDDGRRGAVSFTDLRRRLLDPEAFRRARARILAARQEGRRVWLVMEAGDVIEVHDRLRDSVGLSEKINNAGTAGIIRSNQIRAYLEQLYGPPDMTAVPPDRRTGDEILLALLYR